MKKITQELEIILKNHQHWLKRDCEGWENMRADLRRVDLYEADLSGANLYGADLRGANLRRADLYGASLRGANLYGASLCEANLEGADLRGANLYKADLSGTKNVPFIPYVCPDFGMFIGYKKAHGYIVELEIPEDAKRLSATTRKCRCNKAKGYYYYKNTSK